MQNNQEIREAIFKSNISKWIIAQELNIDPSTFSRKLRKELPEEEKEKILDIIKRLSN